MKSGREEYKRGFKFVIFCKICSIYEKQTKNGSNKNKLCGLIKLIGGTLVLHYILLAVCLKYFIEYM